MHPCRICGEDKPPSHFKTIKQLKGKDVKKKVWCKSCQKLWLHAQKIDFPDVKFVVYFN